MKEEKFKISKCVHDEAREITRIYYEDSPAPTENHKNERYNEQVYVPADAIESMLEDLVGEYQHLQEEFENHKAYVEDNYRHLSVSEQIGL